LSSPIEIPGDTGATFSLFGFRAEAFGAESETIGAMLANHAAIALISERQERQFKAALATRDVIGQAKGLIMERFGVDAARAFAMLTAISQETNAPVRDLAARFVDTAKQ
jgi:ANTAR domain